MHAKVNARLKTAHKENDTIYCQPVPSLDAVETITKKALVKPLEIPEPSELGVSDLFRKMVPLAVIQAASMYSAQKEGLVREAVDGALEATGMAHSTLASLNLPASIEALEVPQGLPAVGDGVCVRVCARAYLCWGEGGVRASSWLHPLTLSLYPPPPCFSNRPLLLDRRCATRRAACARRAAWRRSTA